jgi:hypothetical protein
MTNKCIFTMKSDDMFARMRLLAPYTDARFVLYA